MKNVLTHILLFLKDHCFGILLLLYLPGWLIVLDLIASFSKVHHSPYVIAALLTVSLVVCSVAEAARMARKDDLKLSVFCLIALDILFLVFVFPAYGEVWLKQDYNDTLSNMVLIYRRMEAYQMEHGNYPPQQDLKSLLKTLDIKQSDLNGKGFFYDIGSAEYHAPEDIEGPNDRYMDPVLSVRIRQTLFGKSDKLLVLRRDGSEGYLEGKNGEPRHASQAAAAEPKPADVPSDSIPEETE
ncbi:MAG: hypothetical protein IJT68_07995 [Lentisphaeria bacterium]|nr:hypothetical protein [Lentisphaeria bacterium]